MLETIMQRTKGFPPQHQERQPGREYKMEPEPESEGRQYRGVGKLKNKVAIITGGDSGIGRAVAVSFAKEGAHIVVLYLEEHKDAEETKRLIENLDRRCLLISGDVGQEEFCQEAVRQVIDAFGKLDILVNNAAIQIHRESVENIGAEELERIFRTNIFSHFFMVKASLPFLKKGSVIINSTSVTAYRGSKHLIDYAATKGAIVALTRSLALSLAERGIRVNAVAPGPIWTPLIPASFPEEYVENFGKKVPMGRAGQPDEVAPTYVFLASEDASYYTGQVLHPNGGEIING